MRIFLHTAILAALAGMASLAASVAPEAREHEWSKSHTRLKVHPAPDDSLTLYFIGDVMMHSAQIGKPLGPFLSSLGERAAKADVAVANMEFTLAGKPHTGYPSFSAPDSVADYMAGLGFNIFLCANNHILDKGAKGLRRTISVYEGLKNIQYTGVSSSEEERQKLYPLIIRKNGIRVALLNFTYGTNLAPGEGWPKVNYLDRNEIPEAVRRAKDAGCDLIIALPHWGEEYRLKHSRKQEETARMLAESGIDLIIGSHPHVVQDSCSIKTSDGRKVPVYYSLGNAVSNMSAINTRMGLGVKLTVKKNFYKKELSFGTDAEFIWCTRPGSLINNFKTILVNEYIGRRNEWLLPADYDNMIETLARVQESSGIKE